jgi:hypothetical protein
MNITSSLCPYSLAKSYPDAYKKAAENFGFPDLSIEGLIETLATDDVDFEELEDMIAKEISNFVPEHLLPVSY